MNTELGLHESGMSPRSADDRPVHFIHQILPGYNGVERVMTRKEADEIVREPIDVNDWLALMNLGTALYVIGESEKARTTAARAAQLHPCSSTLLNLAVILEGFGEFEKSLALSEQAVSMDPTNQFAGLLWAQGLLRQGKWTEGWQPFCWFCWGRIWAEMEQYIPEWRGEPLKGKKILILQGGGFGDNLMFFRWIGEVKKLGAHVTYACPGDARQHPEHKTSGSMVELLDGHPWIDRLVPTREGPETNWLPEFDADIVKDGVRQYDYFAPIMGLPRIFNTTVDRVPGREPYIHVKSRIQLIHKRPRVGVSWKAGEVLDPRRHRSLTEEQTIKLLSIDSVDWVSLQLDAPPIPILTPDVMGWKKTAEIIAGLDLVVTVDSSIAHLAGAMGKECFVILPSLSDWKWLTDRDDCVFYPSIRVFRNGSGKTGMDESLDKTIEAIRSL